ncbi:putative mitochondrial inner membrane protease subunit 1 [Triangularia verruculosa]|uniref:Mitochondrial inner membrane protease subunit n=1 Tax=Triangularia verruculosa TaxID=2587418 RepID=A0AAN7B072_9PEZI|nr:putative mitochondrial inner membrane protease subunit 1 [Triangularia verruculosa]
MSSLPRLRAVCWRPRLSSHSSLRSLTRLSLTQPYSSTISPPHSSRPQSLNTIFLLPRYTYSTTATITQVEQKQQQDNKNNNNNNNSQNEPPPREPLFRHPIRLLLSYLKLLALLHLFWNHILSLAPAEGPSMLATYPITGTWVLTSRFHRHGRDLHVGDLVTYHIPDRPSSIGVKRVLGLPGDYVLIGTPGEFWHTGADPRADDSLMLQVPEGHVYLVGDNLPASNDSRIFGPVPLGLIRSKVIASMEPSFQRGPFANFQWVKNPMTRDEPPTREEVLAARAGR